MTRYRLGRREPAFRPAHMRGALVMRTVLDALGTPPDASNDYVAAVTARRGKDWGMFLNDTLGDCTAADAAHALMLRTANTGNMVVPSDGDVLALYEATGHYIPGQPDTDQGAQETDVCAYIQANGFCGHKSSAWGTIVTGAIEPRHLSHIKWGIQAFGSVRLGVNLPNGAEDQFEDGKSWTVSGDLSLEGGHDVLAVRYDPGYLYVVTWGAVQPVAWDWVTRFVEEAHIELFPDWIRAQGVAPSGLNLARLETDLREATT